MDLKARVNVNFARVDIYFQNGHCDLINSAIDFFILISVNTKIPVILHTKFQANIPSHSGKQLISMVLLFFSISSHLGFSTRLTFTGLKPCSLIMLHMKFESHGCSGFREKVV